MLCAMAAVALSAPMPQSSSGQSSGGRFDGFFKYLGQYQKIFANPANHKDLQAKEA